MINDSPIVDISLVILTFNRSEGLRRCLDSILRMKRGEILFEVIVVDDGSETDNLPVISQFKETLGIRYFKKKNEGVASTRNFGLRKSRGKLIGFIADDYTLPEYYLFDVMEFLDRNPDAWVITHNIRPTGPSVFRYVQRLYFQMTLLQRFEKRELDNDVVKSLDLPPSRGAVFRKEVFQMLGHFNEDFRTGEDGEFGMRMASNNMPVYFFMNKYIDHWEDKGLFGYLGQRVRYGKSHFRALKSQYPVTAGIQPLMSVFSSTIERYCRWVKLSYNIGRGFEYMALSPFIILFLVTYYGSFYTESKRQSTYDRKADYFRLDLKESLFRISSTKGLKFSGTAAYSLCARVATLIFRMSPEIRSVFLTGSMAGGDIAPGLSDIDFVIVVRERDNESVYGLLKNLEKKLRYTLPPFGKDKIGVHVVVYTSGEWNILGDLFRGKKSGGPLVVYDKDRITFTNRFSPALKALHHFYKAHWRLDTIEQNIAARPINHYELQLRERLIGRCFRSMLNGIEENKIMTGHENRISESKLEIEDLLLKSSELGSDGLHPAILARLLHFFDLATNGSVTPGEYLYQNDSGESPETSEEKEPVDRGGLNRARDISIVLKEEIADYPVFYRPDHNTDYFIYDLSRYQITEKLIGYYMRNKERGFSMLSKARVDNLYFVLQGRAVYFTKLGDNKRYLLKAGLDDDRIILESYAIFPQLRSLINIKDQARYEAFREKARKLIKLIETRIPSEGRHTASTKEDVRDPESSRYDGSEYERFTNLREISDILRDKINSFLESNKNSMRASRTAHRRTSVPGGPSPD